MLEHPAGATPDEDGETPLESAKVGRRVTRLKAKMYNKPYLDEVNFWRDILSGGRPRFILDFGAQSIVVSSELLSVGVRWPGVAGDKVSYKNKSYLEDLFSVSDLRAAIDGDQPTWDDDDDNSDEDEPEY